MSQSPLVTISASYGAGGSRVAPLVAERLDVAFVERVMRREVADRVAGPLRSATAAKRPLGRSLGRVLREVLADPSAPSTATAPVDAEADDVFRRALEHDLHELVDTGGVVLGRAAAVVLRDVPHALHVRMSGPDELRVRQAMQIEDVDEATARWRQATEDMARDAYVRHYYDLDPENPRLYHLTLDSTRLPLEACVEAIVGAAQLLET